MSFRLILSLLFLATTIPATAQSLPGAPVYRGFPAAPSLSRLPGTPSARQGAGRLLAVGPGGFATISQAAAAAHIGDIVEIAPGSYVECAVWRASGLIIRPRGWPARLGPVHVRDATCDGKAIWVIKGNNVLVQGITFSGAAVRDRNGAGIRAEGGSLTVRDSSFIGNENGILMGSDPSATLEVDKSVFERNGKCDPQCAHGIYVGRIARLRVLNSTFRNQRAGHHIKSRALTTEVVGNTITDGTTGTASYLVDVPNGGNVIIRGNTMQKGPRSQNNSTAIALGLEGLSNPGRSVVIDANRFQSTMAGRTSFVRAARGMQPKMTGNNIIGNAAAIQWAP